MDVCGQPGVLLFRRHQSLVVVGPGAIVTRSLPGVDVQFLHHGLRYRPYSYGANPPYHEAGAIVTCSLPGVDVQFLHHGVKHWPGWSNMFGVAMPLVPSQSLGA